MSIRRIEQALFKVGVRVQILVRAHTPGHLPAVE
jgi:hypothetical protein